MQLDVGSEPYLSTAQALCLILSNTSYYKSFANGQRITAMAKSESLPLNLTGIKGDTTREINQCTWQLYGP